MAKSKYPPVAIVGMASLFPGARTLAEFWSTIIRGADQITYVPGNRWLISDYYEPDYDLMHPPRDRTYCVRGAFIPEIPFDPMAYGVLPKQLEDIDSSQLLALWLMDRLVENLGDRFSHIDRQRISCILGATGTLELAGTMYGGLQRPLWTKLMREDGQGEEKISDSLNKVAKAFPPGSEAMFPGLLNNVIAGRVANRFDLGGTNCTVDAACASSLAALSMALHELYLDEADMVITGGAETSMDIGQYMCFTKTPAMSFTGDCRPFANDGDGTILGEGLGMVALRRLEDAERDGDPIYAVIRSIGSSSDGAGTAIYAPKTEGQMKAMERAYQHAGVSPVTVELLEAHGTGTKAGDAAEVDTLCRVFRQADREHNQWCALGSIKSQIGHTKGAAGAASLIKTALALQHKVLPPTLKVKQPTDLVDFAKSPFYLNTHSRPWIHAGDEPRRAGVSSFGFGGTNFHVVLEEYNGPGPLKPRFLVMDSELFLLAADSPAALTAAMKELAELAALEDGFMFAARSSLLGFDAAKPHRLAVQAADAAELAAKLEQARAAITEHPDQGASSPKGWFYGTGAVPGKLAFLFPGQGSQYLEMGAELAMQFDAARTVWDQAASLSWDGLRLDQVVFPIPVFSDEERKALETRLTSTQWAQPAIGAVSASQLALLDTLGVQPACVAGHSFGELAALCAAGAFGPMELLRAARRRGELMHEAAAIDGAMSAVMAAPEALEAMLAPWGLDVVVANRNSPKQAVISGPTAAVQEAEARLKEQGIKSRRLPVASAFHSHVVAEASAPLREFLETMSVAAPRLPVYGNATAAPYPDDPATIRETLARQLAQPVRFQETIEAMYADDVRLFLEVGPGQALSGLVKDCLGERPFAAFSLDQKGADGTTALFKALGQLAVLGVSLRFDHLLEGIHRPADPRAKKPSRMRVMLSGVNPGQRFPAPEDIQAQAQMPPPPPPHVHAGRHAFPGDASQQPATPQGPAQRQEAAPARPAQSQAASSKPAMPREAQPAQAVPPRQTAATAPRQPAPQPRATDRNNPSSSAPGVHPAMSSQHQEPQAQHAHPGGGNGHWSGPANHAAPHAPMAQPTETQMHQAAPHPSTLMARPGVPAGSWPQQHTMPMMHAAEIPAWVQAIQSLQEQTAQTHRMFLQVAERSLAGLEAALTGFMPQQGRFIQHDTPAAARPAAPWPQEYAAPQPSQPPVPQQAAPAAPQSAAAPQAAPVSSVQPATSSWQPLPQESAPSAQATTPAPTPTPTTGQPSLQVGEKVVTGALIQQLSREELETMMMEVVAEKTGYPMEMLDLDMDLENDLGIDSIKRVEILASVQEKVGELPDVDPAEFTGIRTLRDVAGLIDKYKDQIGSGAPLALSADSLGAASLGASAGTSTAVASTAPSAQGQLAGTTGLPSVPANVKELATQLGIPPGTDLKQVMLEIVSEKTGYPIEMLEPSMDIENDLGIDSIKRVEILATVQERFPGLPEPEDPTMLVGLRTLGDIASFIEEQGKALEEGRTPALLAAPAAQEANHPFDAAAAAPGPSAAVPAGVGAMSATPAPQRPAAAPAASAAPHGLLRYVFEPQHKGEPCFVLPGLLDADPAYITGHVHLAPALVQALEPYGVRAVAVEAEQVPDEAAVVIALHGLQDDASLAAATAAAREAFLLTARLARHKEQVGGSLVLVQDTGGALGSDGNQGRALLGGFSSLAKTATFEWPRACVRSIDIERGGRDDQAVASQLAWELLRGGNAFETGLKADGRRLELMPVERPAQRGALPVGREDVLVVTGGARGVTAASIIALARAGQPKLALLGRTALGNDEPAWAAGVTGEAALKKAGLEHFKAAGEAIKPAELNRHVNAVLAQREMHATLAALKRAGSEARYYACDVKDPADVGRTLEAVRRELGPITGLVHGAGVLADKRLVDKKAEHFEAVYTTKVQGLENLLAATQDDPIRLIALFSSVVGRFGNPGQSDYGMANEVLNQVALDEARRRPGCVVKSIGWGAWDSGMVGPALKREFEKRGLVLIGLEQGAQAFVEELADTMSPAVILSGPIDRSALLAMLERPVMERRFDVLVGRQTFPYLDGHRIQGKVVLPFVIASEWMCRAACGAYPELTLNSVESIRLLKGCILEGFDQQLDRITVVLQPPHEGRIKAQLVNAKGQAFYSAALPMAAVTPEQALQPPPADQAHAVNIPGEGLYGTELFHTGPFAAIERITALGPEMVSGSLKGLSMLNWPHEDWIVDPLLVDGALQLTWMWAKRELGKVILPSVTNKAIWFGGQPQRPVLCRTVLKRKGRMGVVGTAWFLDEGGVLLGYVEGVEGYVMTANWQAMQETAAEGESLVRQAGGD